MAKSIKPKQQRERKTTAVAVDSLDTIKKSKDDLLEALEASLGVVSTACKKAGLSRQTYYNYIKDDEEFKAAAEEIAEVALDFAETQLFKQIQAGEVSSTIFYLKTKGKKRGYIEKQQLEVEGEIKTNTVYRLPDGTVVNF